MLNGINTLITAGCSFTQGAGLAPEELPWPKLLANKLNLDLVNLAHPGCGNQHIVNQILSHGVKQNAFYIICWTSWARCEFAKNEGKILHFNPNWVNRNELAKIIYTDYYNPTYLYKKFLTNIILLQSWFKANNLKYAMFDSMHNVHPELPYYDQPDMITLESQIDLYKYIGFQKESIDNLVGLNKLEDGHPDAAGHAIVSDFLHTYLCS